MRDFNNWFAQFKKSISDYRYYVDFEKVYNNAQKLKVELNIINSLIGSEDIEGDFDKLIENILKC